MTTAETPGWRVSKPRKSSETPEEMRKLEERFWNWNNFSMRWTSKQPLKEVNTAAARAENDGNHLIPLCFAPALVGSPLNSPKSWRHLQRTPLISSSSHATRTQSCARASKGWTLRLAWTIRRKGISKS